MPHFPNTGPVLLVEPGPLEGRGCLRRQGGQQLPVLAVHFLFLVTEGHRQGRHHASLDPHGEETLQLHLPCPERQLLPPFAIQLHRLLLLHESLQRVPGRQPGVPRPSGQRATGVQQLHGAILLGKQEDRAADRQGAQDALVKFEHQRQQLSFRVQLGDKLLQSAPVIIVSQVKGPVHALPHHTPQVRV